LKQVLNINLVTYVQLDEAVKYGCLTLKSHMNCKRFVKKECIILSHNIMQGSYDCV